MKFKRIALTILPLILLQACSVFKPQGDENISETPLAELAQPDSITTPSFVLRGQAVIGHEVQTIQPCGSQHQYWLQLPADIKPLAAALTTSPYQPMYAEVIGHLEAPSHRGFDSDYTARFVVEQINILSAENPNRCKTPLRSTRVFGNEPFWSLEFQKAEQAQFSKMGGEKTNLLLKQAQRSTDYRRYEFDNANLIMSHEICQDGMSDSLYGWAASLSVTDGNYKGCATLSNQDPTLVWSGNYTAQSTQSQGVSVSLDLDTDHSALVRYEYSDNTPAIEERGFWQQINNKQVLVVMTRHQQQYLVSQRVFTLEADKLIAKNERVGEILYPIADGGLVLFKSLAQ
ncbi:COG3650 family protein [Vibrio hippocampi]|uniref:Lipoprotein n=1 Tax=Vibrio hippocampi TaxID=654686 RepID=A0ABM8ZL82_9VIBR|nr:hypothetical protein [Vibrio hippocampi]CAH0527377.1 hypothetical protein VHP8226_02678 [Vibrio hippocampi]